MKINRTMQRATWILLGSAVLLGDAGQVRATVIYDNLSAPTTGSDLVSSLGPLADSFSTGSSPVNLVDVQVVLSLNSDPPAFTTVQLLSDNSTSPGSVLTTLGAMSDSMLTGTPTAYDFPLGTPYALAADTRYWIELSTSTGSNAAWGWLNNGSGVGVAGEFYANGNGVFSTASGGRGGEPYQMQVTVSGLALPEPSTFILGGLGLVSLFVAARRRKA